MARAGRKTGLAFAALAGALLAATPAAAQYSAGYKFLEAVKNKESEEVMSALKAPGTTIVNSRDITSGETALHIVTQRRDLVWIQYLLGQGANPNLADNKGVTPLVLATQLGFAEGVEALVASGARVDVADATGETPLIAAVHRRDIPMMRVLLEAGADPDRADNSGRTARDYAALAGPKSALMQEIEKSEKPASQREGAATYGPAF